MPEAVAKSWRPSASKSPTTIAWPKRSLRTFAGAATRRQPSRALVEEDRDPHGRARDRAPVAAAEREAGAFPERQDVETPVAVPVDERERARRERRRSAALGADERETLARVRELALALVPERGEAPKMRRQHDIGASVTVEVSRRGVPVVDGKRRVLGLAPQPPMPLAVTEEHARHRLTGPRRTVHQVDLPVPVDVGEAEAVAPLSLRGQAVAERSRTRGDRWRRRRNDSSRRCASDRRRSASRPAPGENAATSYTLYR